MSLERTLI